MEFKEKHSGKFYRGASVGYGDKTDFAHKGSPGVGRYKLPSIWDRYWSAKEWDELFFFSFNNFNLLCFKVKKVFNSKLFKSINWILV